jgi:hypothetical protein
MPAADANDAAATGLNLCDSMTAIARTREGLDSVSFDSYRTASRLQWHAEQKCDHFLRRALQE